MQNFSMENLQILGCEVVLNINSRIKVQSAIQEGGGHVLEQFINFETLTI